MAELPEDANRIGCVVAAKTDLSESFPGMPIVFYRCFPPSLSRPHNDPSLLQFETFDDKPV